MPQPPASAPARERLHALIVVCVLAAASVIIAVVSVAPVRVSATEMLGATRTPGDAAFIASHRGGGATAPENTLPAITAALAAGFDYVETDVVLTADRYPVLLHDATVDRTTDGHGRVADLTLEEVRGLDAGSWFDSRYAGTQVPTFEEFLSVLDAAQGRAIVELKGTWDAASVSALVGSIETAGLERHVVLASFDARTLALATARTGVVATMLILKHVPADVVLAAQEAGVRGVLVSRKAVLGDPAMVDRLHDAGMRLGVYTLNHDTQWDAVTALGVDGIVTDDPALLSDWQQTVAASVR